jgi:hypothetical protein
LAKQLLAVRLASAEFLNQRAQLRIDRNRKALLRLVPVSDDAPGLKIDIGAGKRA